MTAKEMALIIVQQRGNCGNISCTDCPFFRGANAPIKKYSIIPCAIDLPNTLRVPIFIQYLMDVYGEQYIKELLVEELV